MFAPIIRLLKRRRRTNYRPYSCPYVGGATRHATGTGERPPAPPYELHGIGMGSLGVPREEWTK